MAGECGCCTDATGCWRRYQRQGPGRHPLGMIISWTGCKLTRAVQRAPGATVQCHSLEVKVAVACQLSSIISRAHAWLDCAGACGVTCRRACCPCTLLPGSTGLMLQHCCWTGAARSTHPPRSVHMRRSTLESSAIDICNTISNDTTEGWQ